MHELSLIEDHDERLLETRAYLTTLPPWPEPLPWEPPDIPVPDEPPASFDPTAQPRLVLTDDARIDLPTAPPTDDDLDDPIKERLYNKLPDAVQTLVRFGNMYVEVKGPSEALRDLVSVDFSEADILDIHLQIAALTDVKEADPGRPEAERLDAECMAALNAVLRLGPPVTMGHPDVDLFERRNVEYANARHPATAAEGERRIDAGLARADTLATEHTRKTADLLSTAGDTGRLASYRSDFTRNVIIALGTLAGAVEAAVIGYVPGMAVGAAVEFLLLHKDAIMATAPTWGETGYKWAEYLLMRAQQIHRDAKNHPP